MLDLIYKFFLIIHKATIIETRGKKCEICSKTEGPMNLHEIWEYDDSKHVQTLLIDSMGRFSPTDFTFH